MYWPWKVVQGHLCKVSDFLYVFERHYESKIINEEQPIIHSRHRLHTINDTAKFQSNGSTTFWEIANIR